MCAPGGDWLLEQTQSFSFLHRQRIPAPCMFLPAGTAGIVGAGWVLKGCDIRFWKWETLLLEKLSQEAFKNKHRGLEKSPVQSLA